MPRVVLLNPTMSTLGYSVIAPRWLYVIAQATPTDLVGDPMVIDEALTNFDPKVVGPGDILGIGISTGNCFAGYRALKQAKERGATVIVGGIHATIFPDEPLEMGADAMKIHRKRRCGLAEGRRGCLEAGRLPEALRRWPRARRRAAQSEMGSARPPTVHVCDAADRGGLPEKTSASARSGSPTGASRGSA